MTKLLIHNIRIATPPRTASYLWVKTQAIAVSAGWTARCRLQAISASMYCDDWPARTTYRVPLQWPRTGSMSRVIGWTCHTAPSVCVIYCQSIITVRLSLLKSKQSDIVVQSPPSDMSLPVDRRRLRPIACRSKTQDRNFYNDYPSYWCSTTCI